MNEKIGKIKKRRIPVWGYDMCAVDNDIWLFHGAFNALFKFNVTYGEMKYVIKIEDEKSFEKSLFSGIYHYNGKIFLIPRKAKNFVVYDINKTYYRIFESNNNYEIESVFAHEKYLYCKPVYIKEKIIKIDLEQEKIVSYISLPNDVKAKYENAFYNDICFISDSRVAGVIYPSNQYYILDLDTDEFKILSVDAGNSFSSLDFCKGYLYLYDLDKFIIYRVIPDSGVIKEFFRAPNKISRLLGVWEKYIIIDLTQEGNTYLFDTDDGEFLEFCVNSIKRNDEEENYVYCHGIYKVAENGKAYYLNRYNNRLYTWHGSIEFLIDDKEFYVSGKDEISIRNYMASNLEKFCYENKIIGLQDLIASMVDGVNC